MDKCVHMGLYQDRHINFFLYNIMGKRRTRRNGRRRMHGGDFWGYFTGKSDDTGAPVTGTSVTATNGSSGSFNNPFGYFNSNKSSTQPSLLDKLNPFKSSPPATASEQPATASEQPATASEQPATASEQPASAFGTNKEGGRRRHHRRTKMRGGDFSPNSAFTNAMEVQNIQMASPQTLVGGRRRCKSSRKTRKSISLIKKRRGRESVKKYVPF
jgi:hypothetical protein